MLRLRCFGLAICAMLSFAFIADAQQDEVKAVLKKAIEAHGGETALLKYKAGTSKYKGKIKILNMDAGISGETMFQAPEKLRTTIALNIMDKNIDIVQVFDGKTFWVSVMGKTMEIKDDKVLKELRETLRAEGGGGFVEALKGDYEVKSVGEVKVKGKDTIGILVAKKGQRDMTYFFDKKTYMMLKSERRALDPMSGQEYTEEKYFTEYQVKDGIKVAKHLEVRKDGEEYLELHITDVRVSEKIDDVHFTKP